MPHSIIVISGIFVSARIVKNSWIRHTSTKSWKISMLSFFLTLNLPYARIEAFFFKYAKYSIMDFAFKKVTSTGETKTRNKKSNYIQGFIITLVFDRVIFACWFMMLIICRTIAFFTGNVKKDEASLLGYYQLNLNIQRHLPNVWVPAWPLHLGTLS